MWKTPTPPEDIRTKKFGFGFLFLSWNFVLILQSLLYTATVGKPLFPFSVSDDDSDSRRVALQLARSFESPCCTPFFHDLCCNPSFRFFCPSKWHTIAFCCSVTSWSVDRLTYSQRGATVVYNLLLESNQDHHNSGLQTLGQIKTTSCPIGPCDINHCACHVGSVNKRSASGRTLISNLHPPPKWLHE